MYNHATWSCGRSSSFLLHGVALLLMPLLISCESAPRFPAKLTESGACKAGSRVAVEEIQKIGEEKHRTGTPLLVPTEDAMCSRGYSNQIDCFARIVLLSKVANAVLVLEKFRFWSAPYQHREGRRLEPLERPYPPFPDGKAPPPATAFDILWDIDYFIQVREQFSNSC